MFYLFIYLTKFNKMINLTEKKCIKTIKTKPMKKNKNYINLIGLGQVIFTQR